MIFFRALEILDMEARRPRLRMTAAEAAAIANEIDRRARMVLSSAIAEARARRALLIRIGLNRQMEVNL